MREKLTDRYVAKLDLPESGQVISWDTEVPGYGARLTKEKRSFIFNYRLNGIERRITIGSFPAWSAVAAREEAKRLRRDVEQGVDPLAERQKAEAVPTVKQLGAEFMGEDGHGPRLRPSSLASYESIIRTAILPHVGRMRVDEVRRVDVEKMFREVTKRAPVRANRALAVLSKMFTFAIVREYRADNPCKHVARNQEDPRQRFYSTAEIARLADALGKYGNQDTADAVRLGLFTGARKGEVVSARWSDIDLSEGVWTKPSAHTKQKREHRVPLAAPALELLNRRREAAEEGEEFVFPSSRKNGEPLERVSACWAFVRKEARLKNARLHDLRHCFASVAASGGASLPLIGALLGHTQARTTQRYAHLHDEPLREVVEAVGRFMTTATNKPAPVVPMRRGRK